ncbi:MAG: M13 family metallopeptidase [Candidatus Saccharimonadales bacterium]
MPKFDKTLRPQDDFFHYVNNDWLKDNPIPPSENAWGTFYILRDKSMDAINAIVDELANTSDDKLNHDQKLIKTFFSTSLNYTIHENNHRQTLAKELEKIQKISDKKQLSSYLGHAHRQRLSSFWTFEVSTDDKNSQLEVFRIFQDGLRLPNRDYYLEDNKRMKKIRQEYEKFYTSVGRLIPELLNTNWKNIFDIELDLAKASWTDIELRDIERGYNSFSIDELGKRFKGIDWPEYFKQLGWKIPNCNVIVGQPSFIENVSKFFNDRPLADIKDYLSWNIINDLMSWISKDTTACFFNFYGKIISGKKEQHPLWKRTIMLADNLVIGEALGREYAQRHFPESSKKAVLNMVEDIRAAYHRRIDQVTWMEDDTKKMAHIKLDNMRAFIGYPSKWRDLNMLNFSSYNHLANILAANVVMSDIETAKAGNKTPYEEWHMNAHTVNAYNNLNHLAVYFPAAILQPPFFDPKSDYPTNLGGIGSFIGHELTHGFDDQGAEFDEHGNLKRWQTKKDQSKFKELAKNIVKQADNYEVAPGVFLRGDLILGEAIADIGGLEMVIDTLKSKTPEKDINNDLKKLFHSVAYLECCSIREEYQILLAKTDPHPPGVFRINCVLPHINAFYDTFEVTEKDKMYLPPENRAHIW